MRRVFISHKREDSLLATRIASRLQISSINTYLDVLDPQIAKNGDDLGEYFRRMIGTCSHLLAVVSSTTVLSWWVPFEIGIATEKSFPLASYISLPASVPDYLAKWPYLRSDSDIDKFAVQIGRSEATTFVRNLTEASLGDRLRYAKDFHWSLKRELRQI